MFHRKMELEIERERLHIEQIRVENDFELKKLELRKSSFTNPLFLGVCVAAIGLISNALVTFLNGEYQRELEEKKTESNLIQDAMRTNGDQEIAAMNLQFLTRSGLVKDPILSNEISKLANDYSNLSMFRGDSSFRSLLLLKNGSVIYGKSWRLNNNFHQRDEKVDFNLSGGACIDEHFCVAAGDRNHYASIFSLTQPHTISPDNKKIFLSSIPEKLDIEAVAYENNYFLFAGSHSVALDDGCRKDQRHGVYLVPSPYIEDGAIKIQEGDLPEGMKQASLDYFLSTSPIFSPAYDRLLQHNGLNIEGAALDGKEILFGIRAPTGTRKIRLLKLNKDDFFDGKEPNPDVLEIEVERDGIGIRDMAKVENGFFFLTGDSQSEAPPELKVACDAKKVLEKNNLDRAVGNGKKVGNPFELYFWDGKETAAQLIGTILGTFPNIEDIVKAEGLIVLPRPWSNKYKHKPIISILIFFDGISNGAATSFDIPLSLLTPKNKQEN